MNLPFFGLERQYEKYRESFLEISDKAFSSGHVLQGKEVTQLEKALALRCNRLYGVAVGSCTDALAFSLLAHDIGPGDEVIVTSLSFVASVSPIVRIGATPTFVDIEPEYFMMNPDLLNDLVTNNTKAIIGVHLFGQMFDPKPIEHFAQKHNLILIEDAAQALGTKFSGRHAGSIGDASCISFDPTKVIGSYGSGGIVLTDNSHTAERIKQYRYHGKSSESGQFEILGYNSQLASDKAGMLHFKLNKLDEWIKARNTIAQLYFENLSEITDLQLPKIKKGSGHNWHKFVIRTKHRDALQAYMNKHNIETKIHYSPTLPNIPMIQNLKLSKKATNTPTAELVSGEVLSLPIYPELTLFEAEYVTKIIKKFFRYRR